MTVIHLSIDSSHVYTNFPERGNCIHNTIPESSSSVAITVGEGERERVEKGEGEREGEGEGER